MHQHWDLQEPRNCSLISRSRNCLFQTLCVLRKGLFNLQHAQIAYGDQYDLQALKKLATRSTRRGTTHTCITIAVNMTYLRQVLVSRKYRQFWRHIYDILWAFKHASTKALISQKNALFFDVLIERTRASYQEIFQNKNIWYDALVRSIWMSNLISRLCHLSIPSLPPAHLERFPAAAV